MLGPGSKIPVRVSYGRLFLNAAIEGRRAIVRASSILTGPVW
jgi:hypothetical protein